MPFANISEPVRKFYDHARQLGFPEELFLSADNLDRYIGTSIDAYRDYPLFLHVFRGRFDEKTFCRMMTIDFRSRLQTTAGIACSGSYESVMLLEPPGAKKVGMRDYVRVADAGAYTLLLKPVMYRLEGFERYARNKRAGLMDDKTWYIYIFATKKKFQRQGYGRKIMDVALSYADRNGCRICLETNLIDNIPMYEHFGFRRADSTYYQETLAHDVMLFEGRG